MGKLKIAGAVVFFIIVILIISLGINAFLLRYNVININKIFLDGEKITISRFADEQLNEIYTPELKVEIPTCLAGEITNDGIRIDSVTEPPIIDQSEMNVTFVQCPVYIGTYRTIGTLHNHPNGNCGLSSVDTVTYVSEMRRGQEVIGVSCDEGLVFYVLSLFESEVEEI
ncbi:hypothetical protein CMI37_09345 [Candidatus Pacearchaeota archaeon]|nr:hypothetical protein [Candidatus Pacearchaeota archaeon]|tara:strand:- start:1585 stop:2094 length:510 start_codon:yes stop_codon:yes gene_type:complete